MARCSILFAFCSTVVCVLPGSSVAQTTVVISDSSGNETHGRISGGHVYLYDSNGNQAFGTVRDGHVFLNTSKGEAVFGTVNDGQVFLTDDHGVTTGTIRNGYIFLTNSDGSVTTGTYRTDSERSIRGEATTTGAGETPEQQREEERQRELVREKQQEYEAGEVIGRAIASRIQAGIDNHRVNSFCKANPTSAYLTRDGFTILCPDAVLGSDAEKEANDYCRDNPGSWIGFGKHRVDCLTPPDPPNLNWAKWEMDSWRWDFSHQARLKLQSSGDQIQQNWSEWRQVYCSLAGPSATFKSLDGKRRICQRP